MTKRYKIKLKKGDELMFGGDMLAIIYRAIEDEEWELPEKVAKAVLLNGNKIKPKTLEEMQK